jgi:hypothetical protein
VYEDLVAYIICKSGLCQGLSLVNSRSFDSNQSCAFECAGFGSKTRDLRGGEGSESFDRLYFRPPYNEIQPMLILSLNMLWRGRRVLIT